MTFEATTDRALVRARGGSRRYLRLRLEAPAVADERPRTPVDLAVVVDRSGSMNGSKMDYAREGALQVVRSLRDGDRLSVVAYDDQVDVLLPSVAIDGRTRSDAQAAIERLVARGTTNLCAGWLRGCEQAATQIDGQRLARVLLMSDGLANRGITDHDEIAEHAKAVRARGVSTSTFGIGEHFDEELLARMAESGGGNFYYIETAGQIPDFVASEVGESLDVVAREVVLNVRAPEGVTVNSLNDFPVRRDGALWRVSVGALVSRQVLEPTLEICFPDGQEQDRVTVLISVTDVDGALDEAAVEQSYRYASDPDNDRQPRNLDVSRTAARLAASKARREALRFNRERAYDEARDLMLACANEIARYAADDPAINDIVRDLQTDAARYRRQLSESDRKRRYSASIYATKMKSGTGRSVRSHDRHGTLVMLPLRRPMAALIESALHSSRPALRRLFTNIDISDRLMAALEDRDVALDVLIARDEAEIVEMAARAERDCDIRIVSTGRPLEDNWFSHWHGAQRTVVSSLFAWDQTATVAPEAFIVYEILLYGLHGLSPRYDLFSLAHEETRGCLFDFCGYRPEIEIKLQTMDVCPQCEGALRRFGVDLRGVREVCEAVRQLAQGGPSQRQVLGE